MTAHPQQRRLDNLVALGIEVDQTDFEIQRLTLEACPEATFAAAAAAAIVKADGRG